LQVKTSNLMQFTCEVVMIQPVSFGFNEETGADNAFMNRSESTLYISQMQQYKSTLESYGILTHYWEHPDPAAKDCIFANNWFTTISPPFTTVRTLILCPMRHPSRRLERRPEFVQRLSQSYPNLIDLTFFEQQNKHLEGTGSMVIDRKHKQILMSVSERSSVEVLQYLVEKLNEISEHRWTAVWFASRDERGQPIYHTNIVLALTPKKAVVNMESIDEGDREKVRRALEGYEIVEIGFGEMRKFAGNVEVLYSPILKEEVAFVSKRAEGIYDLGCRTEYVDISEIEDIGGGSTQCMLAKLF
jgi:hypothetical protein